MLKKFERDKIHLYLRTDKKRKDGKMPLYIRFKRIDGEEPKYPLKGYSYSFEEWDRNNQSPIPPSKELDEEIDRIIQVINFKTIYEEFEMSKSLLKTIVAGKVVQKPENESFYEHFNNFLSIKKRNKIIAESTYKAYITTLNALKEFRKTIRIRDINAKLLNRFANFMQQRGNEKGKGNVSGSIRNRHKNIDTVIKYIEAKKIPIENPYSTGEVVIPKDIPNDVFLNDQEFDRMYKLIDDVVYEFELESVEIRVLLMYLFSCIEGLRISDIQKVKWGDINFDLNPIILTLQLKKNNERKKTEIRIPIFPLAIKILLLIAEENFDNVENENRIFNNQYANYKINTTLRKLAKMAGIEKYITFHSSRRTFATLASLQGTDLKTLKAFMGHSSTEMTERYVKWQQAIAENSVRMPRIFRSIEDIEKKLK